MKSTYRLNNSLEIPVIGLGASVIPFRLNKLSAWKMTKRQMQIYHYAIHRGCRLFDTSYAYGQSVKILGKAIKNAQRSELCIMAKISNAQQRAGNIEKALESLLRELRTDYIDLLLLHWPQTETYVSSWLQMEKLYQDGRVRGIGVSNFHQHHLEELQKVSDIIPVVNQIEVHPLLTQKPLIHYCNNRGIQVVSYSPLGRMHDVLIKSKPLRMLSEKYRRTVPQIILRWNIQLGLIPIPRTLTKEHWDEFANIFDFALTEAELDLIDSINENIRLRYNPDTCDFSIL